MSAKLLVAAALGAWLFLALFWPATCRTTQMGFPPGAPDINTTGCDGFFGQGLGSIREFEGGADVLLPQLRIRASVVTLAVVVVLLAAGRLTRHRSLSWRGLATTVTAVLAVTVVTLMWSDQGWFMNLDATTSSSG